MNFPYLSPEEYKAYPVTSIPSTVGDDQLEYFLKQGSHKVDSVTFNRGRSLDDTNPGNAMRVEAVKEATKLCTEYLYSKKAGSGSISARPVVSQHIKDASIQFGAGDTATDKWLQSINVDSTAYTILDNAGLTYRGR